MGDMARSSLRPALIADDRPCAHCGTIFTPRSTLKSRHINFFCSDACRYRYRDRARFAGPTDPLLAELGLTVHPRCKTCGSIIPEGIRCLGCRIENNARIHKVAIARKNARKRIAARTIYDPLADLETID
uniref:Uncharacterized protein n=1 Tax=mine drainage metagenome TaxID=410659 RepID=E6QP98_9ZZZZ